MNPTRWEQVKSVVGDALDLADTRERIAFLTQVCGGDQALRREVDSLLAHSNNRLDDCAAELSLGGLAPADSRIAQRIGAYRIVRELGRGGMGAVYLAARADDEFQKEVAIKILKRGTDTDEVLRRFRSERQILARLDHPNIARLLDGGTTDDGLPYFVMEYVAGARITDYCSENSLSFPERLALFRKVCATVQFAHQNLIVHRDLKPANVLVTTDGEPKLLDFGIAKLLDSSDNAIDLTIADRQRLTPAYASPEQVRGEPITTVSDVYSLGVILYELLAGVAPHRFENAPPSQSELLQIVAEREPTRPSAATSDLAARTRLRGDLDRIVLKALRKEPAARYSGVGSFSEDIRRYLEGLPVHARPATFGYRAGKFIRRNRRGVFLGVLALLALLGGTGVTIWNAHRAEVQARRAERHFQDVRQLANSFLFEFHDAIATLPGSTAARQLVVNRALQYLDKLAREAAGDRALQLELAEAYLKVGDVQGRPYSANLGDADAARQSYFKAIEIAQTWATREKNSPEATARNLVSRGLVNLAAAQARAGELQEAKMNNTRALAVLEELLRDAPARGDEWRRLVVSCHTGMGDAVQAGNHRRGDLDAYRTALGHYRDALPAAERLHAAHPTSWPDQRLLAKTCARIAGLLAELGARTKDIAMQEEALAFHERRLRMDEEGTRLDPNDSSLRRNVADGLVAAAYARVLALRELPRALADCERALAIEEPLASSDPSNREAQQDLSYAYYITGRVHQAEGNSASAAERYRQSIQILEPLVAANRGNVETEFDLERSRRGLAEVTSVR